MTLYFNKCRNHTDIVKTGQHSALGAVQDEHFGAIVWMTNRIYLMCSIEYRHYQ